MCGIFSFLGKQNKTESLTILNKITHRGPDNTQYTYIQNKKLFLGFTRLSINGLDDISNQPFNIGGVYLICNGEIYNYKELIEKYHFKYKTNSDCEIIIHMYNKFGIDRTLLELDGVFAFVLYDSIDDTLYAARDPIGIRSLYIYQGDHGTEYGFASEMKCLTDYSNASQFLPGFYWTSKLLSFVNYYNHVYMPLKISRKTIISQIRETFIRAVEKRLMSDRPIGCLLSGGLDSTITTAIVCQKYNKKVNTYAIGMKGSVDLKYARIAADYLGTNHHEVLLTEQDFLDAIDKTIYQIESWDTTTVRASVGNYLVSLYIKDNTDNKVIFCGDVSDELFASYRGFMNAPDKENFYNENLRMIQDIYLYDVLRSDKSISGAGLEARVPFADKEFVNLIMSIPSEMKMFNDEKMEKYILREAFNGYLPKELLWRRKEAFSDGVSSHERSWFEVIKEYVNTKYTEEEYKNKVMKYSHCPPYDKESLYYREIFNKYYKDRDGTIPYYWRHPFSKILDPSARLLDCYKDGEEKQVKRVTEEKL